MSRIDEINRRIDEINRRIDKLNNMEMMIECADFLSQSDKECLAEIRLEQADLLREKDMLEMEKSEEN